MNDPERRQRSDAHVDQSMGPLPTNIGAQNGVSHLLHEGDKSPDVGASIEAFQQALPPRYELKRIIGQGGMGQVFEAVDRDMKPFGDGRVAIKRMLGYAGYHTEALGRLKREFEIAQRLSQQSSIDNVVKMYEYGTSAVGPYLVMQYIEGMNLDEFVRSKGALDSAHAQTLFVPLARTLDIAHRLQVIHCDIKPSNILISNSGRAFLLDFGIARQVTDADRTGTGLGAGTLQYMSPEQLNNRPPNSSQDIYSFSATLYFAIEGKPLFTHKLPAELISAVLKEVPPKCRSASAELAQSIALGLSKTPDSRPLMCMDVVLPTKQKKPWERKLFRATGLALAGLLLLWLGWKNLFEHSQQTQPKVDASEAIKKNSKINLDNGVNREVLAEFEAKSRNLSGNGTASSETTISNVENGNQGKETEGASKPTIENSTEPLSVSDIDSLSIKERMSEDKDERDDNHLAMKLCRSEVEGECYWIGQFEVTEKEWFAVMETGLSPRKTLSAMGAASPDEFEGDYPIENVSWSEAVEFCRRLTALESKAGRLPEGMIYRLPQGKEWLAARGSLTNLVGESELRRVGWFGGNDAKGSGGTKPVGKLSANSLGIYDLYGNVEEMCLDSSRDGSSQGDLRLVLGGSCFHAIDVIALQTPSWTEPSAKAHNRGFRVVLGKAVLFEVSFPKLGDIVAPPLEAHFQNTKQSVKENKGETFSEFESGVNLPSSAGTPEPEKPSTDFPSIQTSQQKFEVGMVCEVKSIIGPSVLFSREQGDDFVEKNVYFDKGQKVVIAMIGNDRIKITTVSGSRPGWMTFEQAKRFLRIVD
ncbi:MAG: SUMF1/EgtB/PvdO family nonheme iron enzyme [Planctomycetaceae bacterium]|nr:SUMF1/EgtB/PvdO family nonheme iron enzyme [Planctomycetaceae bacterium]